MIKVIIGNRVYSDSEFIGMLELVSSIEETAKTDDNKPETTEKPRKRTKKVVKND